MANLGGYAHLDATTLKVLTAELGGASFLNGDTGIAVNLKNTGQTTLYTVPNGKNLFLTDCLITVTGFSALVTPPIIRLGKSPGFIDFVGLTTLPSFTGVGNYFMMSQSALNLIRNALLGNDVLSVDVQTGANATMLTADFYPIGYVK